MSASPTPPIARPLVRTAIVLAIVAYLPALTAAPGRMPADSKLYLYLDPGRLMADAAGTFDPRQFAGWVPHQHIAYLWPSGPWFWGFDVVGVPDWVAHRLWIGTLMLAAGLGVRWCARLLGLSAVAALVAALVYQMSPYVLPYVSRTSVMLLPWAGLGWIVAFTVRATRRHTWADPAAIALIVLTVGAVNATALTMIVPAPLMWLVHTGWQRTATWRQVAAVAGRVTVLSAGVSLWWVAMLVIQGRYGADVLPYSESLADVSLTSTAPEVWRGMGYWLFYVRDPYAATTTASLRYLTSTASIVVSFLVPIACLCGLVWVRWAHRRFATSLVAIGALLAVGVHPIADRSPLMRLVAGDGEGGVALALRSSTRALPVMYLGLALAAGSMITALERRRVTIRSSRAAAAPLLAGVLAALAVVNLPVLWTGGFVDPALERAEDPPPAWLQAAAALDRGGAGGRVLQLPGEEFGAYRWGYTVDQPLPGLTSKPLVTRDLLPLGSPAAMDLLYALDDRVQEGVLEPTAIAPVARLLGVDTVWLTNDVAFDRFRTARPEDVRALVDGAAELGPLEPYGFPTVNRPDVVMTDERALGDPRVGQPIPPVELAALDGSVIRATDRVVVVSGSGDGLVDAAAAGLVDGRSATVVYSAGIDALPDDTAAMIVTDSNRPEARQWRSSQDTRGFTESGTPSLDVLRAVPSDRRLPVFDDPDPDTRTLARQRGAVTVTASAYGEPFAYLPEHRPFMAIDGDLATAWLVGEHGDPVGERLRLYLDGSVTQISLRQPLVTGARRIAQVSVVESAAPNAPATNRQQVALDDRSIADGGQPIAVDPTTRVVDIVIDAVGGGDPGTGGAVAGVGFVEIATGLGPGSEVVTPPTDGLDLLAPSTPLALVMTRLRHDPMDRWRDDPEPALVREFELPEQRSFQVGLTMRIDARATDHDLARLFDWPVAASSRLTGSPRNSGVAAFDRDPATAWITAFGDPVGAHLAIDDVDRPVRQIAVRQPVTGFSEITSLRLRSGTGERTVELATDASGVARADVEPPLPAGPLDIEIASVDTVTTVDRRFGDTVVLPAAMSEVTIAGAPVTHVLGSTTSALDCIAVAEVDGGEITASVVVEGDGWLDGGALTVTPCDPAVDLAPGRHLLSAADPDLPIQLDRVVFDDGVRSTLAAPRSAVATVLDRTRFARRVAVGGCDDGCRLVLGEGWNPAWSASIGGRDLGEPELVDGGFNGWRLPASDGSFVVDVRWTVQRPLTLALLASPLVALVAAAVVLRDVLRRRRSPAVPKPVPAIDLAAAEPIDGRRVLGVAVAWIALPALLIGPGWALAGAVAGATVVFTRRARLPELVALASVVAIGAGTAFIERRDAPFPGGGWPSAFESLHGFGMFAIVALVVGALTATDAAAPSEAAARRGPDDQPDDRYPRAS